MSFLQSLRDSVGAKIAAIGFIALLLLIPIGQVSSIVKERSDRREQAVNEITSKWGMSQDVVGPILVIPYHHSEQASDGTVRVVESLAYFLPEKFEVEGRIDPTVRSRGMFDAVLYTAELQMSAAFSAPDARKIGVDPSGLIVSRAAIVVRIPDPRGIRTVDADWNQSKATFESGTGIGSVFGAGIHLPVGASALNEGRLVLKVKLNGSGGITFAPVGKTNRVHLTSTWADPSFSGTVLPVERTVGASGFDARWDVSHFARNAPESWTGPVSVPETSRDHPAGQLAAAGFGTNLVVPADSYLKTERALKYAMLVIGMTFLAFFLFEIFFRLRIHPFQYLLLGAALVLFYTVFLAVSEHTGFSVGYLSAALCAVLLVTLYSIGVLKNGRRALYVGLLLSGVYTFLYFVMESQDYSLLMGAGMLVAGLGLVMYLTRKIDWYNIKLTEQTA